MLYWISFTVEMEKETSVEQGSSKAKINLGVDGESSVSILHYLEHTKAKFPSKLIALKTRVLKAKRGLKNLKGFFASTLKVMMSALKMEIAQIVVMHKCTSPKEFCDNSWFIFIITVVFIAH